jgi:hypothetical protein
MVSLRQKKTTVSTIRQPMSLILESSSFSQRSFLSITIAFEDRGAAFLLRHRLPLLTLAAACVCPLARPISPGEAFGSCARIESDRIRIQFHVHEREV